MKTLALNQMKVIEGGNESKNTATGFMCGAAVCFLFMGPLAPIAGACAVGCALGLFS
jgi:hypothetical protein